MFPKMLFFPDCFKVIRGASRLVAGAPRPVVGAPRCSQTYHNHSHVTPEPIITDPSYSKGRPECPPTVWHSPEIDASKFTLHILWNTPGGSQWVNYILVMHVCGNGQQWAHRNAAQFPRFAKSLCVCNYSQSGRDRSQSDSSKPCGNNSEVLGIEWAAPGICTGCPSGAKQSSTPMAIEPWTQWLWKQSEWSPPALWSGSNESPAWSDEPTQHHDEYDIPDSGVSVGPYNAAYGACRLHAIRWWGWTIIIRAVKWNYVSLNIQPTQSHQLMQNWQLVWRIRRNWEVQEYWLEFDSIPC